MFKRVLLAAAMTSSVAMGQTAYKIGKKSVSMADVKAEDQATFYDLEKKIYERVEQAAKSAYLDHYWQKLAKEKGKSISAVKKDYEKKNLVVSEKEINETLEKYKDRPPLNTMKKPEQIKEIRNYLEERERRTLFEGIVNAAMASGELKVMYPKPVEPVYNVVVTDQDQVRYGPKLSSTKPQGCKDDCPITIVEYSEFQCPYCVRVLPATNRVLTDYKGQVRWVVRDFPLSFHKRAKPAAVAAHCAGDQGKYWFMYKELFDNQRKLEDADFKVYAKRIGLDEKKFAKCYENAGPKEAIVEANLQSGFKVGVSGTPAFFINGRRLSGAVPFERFKEIIDEELAKTKS